LDTLLVRMDQIQETAHPLSAAAAPVANYNIQPVAKMPPQMDKRLRSLEEQVCSQCLLYGTEGANISSTSTVV